MGGVEGRRRKGIDLVRTSDAVSLTEDDSASLEHTYRVEVWSEAPEAGGEILETISRATDFSVSAAAYRAALRARPGKTLVHLNGRHRMSAEKAQDPPVPEHQRPSKRRVRPRLSSNQATTTSLSLSWSNGTFWLGAVRNAIILDGWIGGSLRVGTGSTPSSSPCSHGSDVPAAATNAATE